MSAYVFSAVQISICGLTRALSPRPRAVGVPEGSAWTVTTSSRASSTRLPPRGIERSRRVLHPHQETRTPWLELASVLRLSSVVM